MKAAARGVGAVGGGAEVGNGSPFPCGLKRVGVGIDGPSMEQEGTLRSRLELDGCSWASGASYPERGGVVC